MQKIYLASPFFNEYEENLVKSVAERLRERFEVFVPMEHTAEGEVALGDAAWGKEIFEIDRAGIEWADTVVALDHGFTSDAGTSWEIGYAYARGKTVYAVSAREDEGVRSLMLLNGCTRYFGRVEDLFDFLDGKDVPHYEVRGIRAK